MSDTPTPSAEDMAVDLAAVHACIADEAPDGGGMAHAALGVALCRAIHAESRLAIERARNDYLASVIAELQADNARLRGQLMDATYRLAEYQRAYPKPIITYRDVT